MAVAAREAGFHKDDIIGLVKLRFVTGIETNHPIGKINEYVEFLRTNSDKLALDSTMFTLGVGDLYSSRRTEGNIISVPIAYNINFNGDVLKYDVKFMTSIPKLYEYGYQQLLEECPDREDEYAYDNYACDVLNDLDVLNHLDDEAGQPLPIIEKFKTMLDGLGRLSEIYEEIHGGYMITDNIPGSAFTFNLNIYTYMENHEDIDPEGEPPSLEAKFESVEVLEVSLIY